MAAAAEPRPADLPLPGGRAGATVTLRPMLTGTFAQVPGAAHREEGLRAKLRLAGIGVSGEDRVPWPAQAFLVEHPGAGLVLVDTGFHASVAVDPRQNLGRLLTFAWGEIAMDAGDAVAARLRALGRGAAEVGAVVMTHLHADHASAVADFPEATFVLDRREWAAATAPRAWMAGYTRRQFDHAFDFRLLDMDAPEVDSFASFGRSLDLFGDGSVRVVSTPGHTPGHLSVVLRLRDREALLAADACFTRRTLETGHLPALMADEHVFRRSLAEIRAYRDRTPDALIVPGHDIEAWRSLDERYA